MLTIATLCTSASRDIVRIECSNNNRVASFRRKMFALSYKLTWDQWTGGRSSGNVQEVPPPCFLPVLSSSYCHRAKSETCIAASKPGTSQPHPFTSWWSGSTTSGRKGGQGAPVWDQVASHFSMPFPHTKALHSNRAMLPIPRRALKGGTRQHNPTS